MSRLYMILVMYDLVMIAPKHRQRQRLDLTTPNNNNDSHYAMSTT